MVMVGEPLQLMVNRTGVETQRTKEQIYVAVIA